MWEWPRASGQQVLLVPDAGWRSGLGPTDAPVLRGPALAAPKGSLNLHFLTQLTWGGLCLPADMLQGILMASGLTAGGFTHHLYLKTKQKKKCTAEEIKGP